MKKPVVSSSKFANALQTLVQSGSNEELRAKFKVFKSASVAEQQKAASGLLTNDSLFTALIERLQRNDSCTATDPVLEWLYNCYQTDVQDLQLYVTSFVPLFIWLHHTRRRAQLKQGGLTACLLVIYNHVVALRDGKPLTFSTPKESEETIYHKYNNEESDLHQSQFSKLTETALQQLTGDVIQGVIYQKAIEPASKLTPANVSTIINTVLQHFVDRFSLVSTLTRIVFCNVVTKLCALGIRSDSLALKTEPELILCQPLTEENNSNLLKKDNDKEQEEEADDESTDTNIWSIPIHLDSQCLHTMLEGIHKAVFDRDNTVEEISITSLYGIHSRGSLALDSGLMLASTSLIHQLTLRAANQLDADIVIDEAIKLPL